MAKKLSDILNSTDTPKVSEDNKIGQVTEVKSSNQIELLVKNSTEGKVTSPTLDTAVPLPSNIDVTKGPISDGTVSKLDLGRVPKVPKLLDETTIKNAAESVVKNLEDKAWQIVGSSIRELLGPNSTGLQLLNATNQVLSNSKGKFFSKIHSGLSKLLDPGGKSESYRRAAVDYGSHLDTGPLPVGNTAWLAGDAKTQANLDDIKRSTNPSGLLNSLKSKYGLKSGSLSGLLQSKLSPDTVDNTILDSITKVMTENGIPSQLKYHPKSTSIYQGGGISSAVKTALARDVLYGDAVLVNTGDIPSLYGRLEDPFKEYRDNRTKKLTLNNILDHLRSQDLLQDYHSINGFEMGSNHDWIVRISPYYSNTPGRYTLTPPLPCYRIPKGTTRVKGLPSDKWYGLESKITNHVYTTLANDLGVNGLDLAKANEEDDLFSFGFNCPALVYNFNIGAVRSDSMRLWNGESADYFNGYQYQSSFNVSILDDIYGSMQKYMQSYVNACYMPGDNELAPYWASAFLIDIIIFRAGKQINWRYKLIGSPIEWSPTYSGGEGANELRVDITFGIIGMIQPNDTKVYSEDRLSVYPSHDKLNAWESRGYKTTIMKQSSMKQSNIYPHRSPTYTNNPVSKPENREATPVSAKPKSVDTAKHPDKVETKKSTKNSKSSKTGGKATGKSTAKGKAASTTNKSSNKTGSAKNSSAKSTSKPKVQPPKAAAPKPKTPPVATNKSSGPAPRYSGSMPKLGTSSKVISDPSIKVDVSKVSFEELRSNPKYRSTTTTRVVDRRAFKVTDLMAMENRLYYRTTYETVTIDPVTGTRHIITKVKDEKYGVMEIRRNGKTPPPEVKGLDATLAWYQRNPDYEYIYSPNPDGTVESYYRYKKDKSVRYYWKR